MVTIAVAGEASTRLPAERGTVRLTVQFESNDRATAFGRAASTHSALVEEAEALVAEDAVTAWQSDRVWVSTVQRYVSDSESPVAVQVASVSLTATFVDFARLGDWLTDVAARDGVMVDGVTWTLTETTLAAALKQMRVQSVRDAHERALAYAEAIGQAGLRLDRVYEPGLRPSASTEDGVGTMARALKTSADHSSVDLKPSDIEVAASITADFTTDAAADGESSG
jgi:uncharacterized protein YggE